MIRSLLAPSLALSLLALTAPPACAQGVVVERIRGPGGRLLERRLTEALREEPGGAVDARVSGRARRRGRSYVVRLVVERPGEDPVRLVRRERSVSDLVSALRDAVLEAVGPPPPAEPEGEPADEDRTVATSEPRSTRAARCSWTDAEVDVEATWDPAPDMIVFALGGGIVGRAQSFQDDVFERLGSYTLEAAPFVTARARWFPLRLASADPWLGIGLQAEAWTALGLSSEQNGPFPRGDIETLLYEMSMGILYRMPVLDVLTVEPAVDIAQSSFVLAGPGPERPLGGGESVPDVEYVQVRPRLAVELALPVSIELRVEAAWLAVLGAGRLDDDDWFPRSRTHGVELAGSIGWRFATWASVRVFVVHARYLSDLAPEPGDPRIAGGALDEWTRGGLEVALHVPGVR